MSLPNHANDGSVVEVKLTSRITIHFSTPHIVVKHDFAVVIKPAHSALKVVRWTLNPVPAYCQG